MDINIDFKVKMIEKNVVNLPLCLVALTALILNQSAHTLTFSSGLIFFLYSVQG